MWTPNTTRSPIGIDLTGKYVRAVQLIGSMGNWRIESAASVPMTATGATLCAEDAQRLWDVLARQKFTGAGTVMSVPEQALTSVVIKAPRTGTHAVRQEHIIDEFVRASSLDINSCELAYWDLPAPKRADNTVDVMAVGCAHADVDGLLDVIEDTGLEITALDTSSAAVARWLMCLPDRSPMMAVVDIEWDSAGVVVVYNDTVIYERAIPEARISLLYDEFKRRKGISEDMFNLILQDVGLCPEIEGVESAEGDGLVRQMTTAHFDRMAQELKTALSYVGHQYREETELESCVIGEGSRIAGLPEHLSQQRGVKMNQAPLNNTVKCPSEYESLGTSAAFVKAVGLALHGV